jgi:hypothetical protein
LESMSSGAHARRLNFSSPFPATSALSALSL